MVTSTIDNSFARDLDIVRCKRLGRWAKLTLLSYSIEKGEQTLAVITHGWHSEQNRDPKTGSVHLTIAAQELITQSIMLSTVRFMVQLDREGVQRRTYRVLDGGMLLPMAEPHHYELDGEELRGN